MPELLQYLLIYIMYTLPVFMIAYKSAHPYSWLAFVPFANLWLMCDMADKEVWWIFLFFLPFINVLAYIVIWMALAENTNKPPWLGLFMVIPGINILTAYFIAFYEPKSMRY